MSIQSDILHHLQCDYTEPVRDPLWKHIYLSRGMSAIVADPTFQQLQRVKQLGPTYLVYPGAVHTRFNHSLGVFHIAKSMITTMVRRRSSQMVEELFSLRGVTNFLLAALLHDLGHFPYAHSLKELISTSHETLGRHIIEDSSLTPLIRDIPLGDPTYIGLIIDDTIELNSDSLATPLSPKEQAEITQYRGFLSGPMDPDKLDYLNRDAFFCGVPYGIQDIDIAIEHMLKGEGKLHIDNLLFSKYLMYKQVYWHPTVRSATAMIKRGVEAGFTDGSLQEEDLYNLDDYSFDALKSGPLLDSMLNHIRKGVTYTSVYTLSLGGELRRESFQSTLMDQLMEVYHKELTTGALIVDIPEPISFEAPTSYNREELLETPLPRDSHKHLSSSLRNLRIFAQPGIASRIDKKHLDTIIPPLFKGK